MLWQALGRWVEQWMIQLLLLQQVHHTVVYQAALQLHYHQLKKIVHGSAGLTLDKLIEAKEKLDANDVDPDEARYMIVTSKQMSNLLNLEKVTSSDYASIKALVQGQIDTYLGFKFLRTERLGLDSNSDRQVLAFCQSGIGLAVGSDVSTRISERADKNYATQVFLSMTIGATRVEDEKVVEIACNE